MTLRPWLLKSVIAPLWRRLPPRVKLGLASFRAPPHQVSVVAVICDDHDRVLLAEHSVRSPRLSPPGGFVAHREQPEDALRREVREEVGLELTHVSLAFVRTLHALPQMEIVFLCHARGAPEVDGLEILSARWVPLADLPADLDPDERERIFRALGHGPAVDHSPGHPRAGPG